jgi:hypothetical protein
VHDQVQILNFLSTCTLHSEFDEQKGGDGESGGYFIRESPFGNKETNSRFHLLRERENKNEPSKHSWALLSPQHSDVTEGKDSRRPKTAETTASILGQIQFFLWEHGRGYAAGYYPANFTLNI